MAPASHAMTLLAPAPSPIVFARRDGSVHVLEAWPGRAVFADDYLRRDVAFCWPYLTLHTVNGHAVYRVGTLDRSVWVGDLVESSYAPPSAITAAG